jgi:hypothetical protein
MYLPQNLPYNYCMQREASLANLVHEGLPTMKLAIRIFALFVVIAGAAAATSSTTNVFTSHQSAAMAGPEPGCGEIPCPPPPPPGI